MRKMEFNVTKQNNVEVIRYNLGATDVYDDRVADKVAQIANIIPFQYNEEDGRKSIISYVHESSNLETMLKKVLNKKEVLCIMSGLVAALEIGTRGIPVSYLVKDLNYIYVNMDTLAVKCILVPIKQEAMPLAEIPELFRTIVSKMKFSDEDTDNYVAKLLTLINSDEFSISKYKALVDELLEKIGLFISKDNGLVNMAYNNSGNVQEKVVKVNKLGVMNNMQNVIRAQNPIVGQFNQQPSQPGAPRPMMQPQMPPNQVQPQMGAPRPMMQPQMPPNQVQPQTGAPRPMMQPQMPPNQVQPQPGLPRPMMQPQMPPNQVQPQMGSPRPMMQPQMPPNQPQPQPGAPRPMMQPQMPPNQVQPQMGSPRPMMQPQMPPNQAQPQPSLQMPTGEYKSVITGAITDKSVKIVDDIEVNNAETDTLYGTDQLNSDKQAPVTHGSLVGQLGTKPIPHIVRKKTGEAINITKPEFSIGKSQSKADYAIDNNPAISRVHCIIVQKDGVNYIKDNNSTNHTYLNGVELQPGKEMLLKNKMVIQLGDEEFTFLLRRGE